jgi:tetratricopeptide (TPR) repeat protein
MLLNSSRFKPTDFLAKLINITALAEIEATAQVKPDEHPNQAVTQFAGENKAPFATSATHSNAFRKDTLPSYRYAYNLAADLEQGSLLQKQGNLDAAIILYTRIIATAPTYSPAYLELGNALGQQGKFTAAIATYEQLIQLDPTNALAYSSLWGVRWNKRTKWQKRSQPISKRFVSILKKPEPIPF